jgi:hypothetical protein
MFSALYLLVLLEVFSGSPWRVAAAVLVSGTSLVLQFSRKPVKDK